MNGVSVTALCFFLAWALACLLGCAETKTAAEIDAMARYHELAGTEWRQVLHDRCTGNWQDTWFLDGRKATVTNGPDGMTFTAGPTAGDDACHAVLWTKSSFQGDLKIDYEYTKTDPTFRNVTILYIQATETDRNLYFCAADPHWAKRHFETQRPLGVDRGSLSADPMFVDLDAGDLRFRPGSPAPKLGIRPLDPGKAGLQPAYRRRLLGKRINTNITPNGGLLKGPMKITIACDAPGAVIRYTLDGTEPTRQSTRYTEPFALQQAATIRAKAFAKSGTDLVGAVARFHPSPQPISEGFEAASVGSQTPHAATSEDADRKQYTARVSDEQAASGRNSLRFADGPGQEYPFSPHVYYRCRFTEGRLVGRFAIRLDEHAQFRYQWRHYGNGYHSGPTVTILPGGTVVHQRKRLLSIPTGQWVRFEVTCGIGKAATGTFTLKVWLPDSKLPKEFVGLPHDGRFRRLDWVGFIANGQRKTTFYVDNIEVRPAP